MMQHVPTEHDVEAGVAEWQSQRVTSDEARAPDNSRRKMQFVDEQIAARYQPRASARVIAPRRTWAAPISGA